MIIYVREYEYRYREGEKTKHLGSKNISLIDIVMLNKQFDLKFFKYRNYGTKTMFSKNVFQILCPVLWRFQSVVH